MAERTSAPQQPFDRKRIAQQRRRAARWAQNGGSEAAFLLARAAEETADRLKTVNRPIVSALDLSGGGGQMTDQLIGPLAIETVVRGDPLTAGPQGRSERPVRLVIDEEALPFADGAFDLIVSLLSLHLVNDLPGALVQIRRALRPDGLFLATIPAGETLHELRSSLIAAETALTGGARPRVAPFASLQGLAGLLQRAGFALPVADSEKVVVRYRDMSALLADLRAMGMTGALAGERAAGPPRALFEQAAVHYAAHHADPDGRIRATFAFAHLSGWAPHESQQKPLRPGSAKARLADALRTVEVSAGEAADPDKRED